jgi:hypothetical protein
MGFLVAGQILNGFATGMLYAVVNSLLLEESERRHPVCTGNLVQ